MFRNVFIPTAVLTAGLFLAIPVFRDEKKAAITAMMKFNMYEGMHHGHYDDISPLWKHYKVFAKKLSEQELIDLCVHDHPVVRCYAFAALTDRCSAKLYDVVERSLVDTVVFLRGSGCFANYEHVSDFFLERVSYDRDWLTGVELTEDQYRHIDSVLLFGDEITKFSGYGNLKYSSCETMLKRIEPTPAIYDRVKELVIAGVYDALPLLAKYQKPQDTTLIIEMLLYDQFDRKTYFFNDAAKAAVLNFPHPSFYPILKNKLLPEASANRTGETGSFDLYLALVQYPTKATRELLEQVLVNAGDEYRLRSTFIRNAIEKYPSEIFKDLGTESQTGKTVRRE